MSATQKYGTGQKRQPLIQINDSSSTMHLINLATTLSLIERSERTLWRLVAEGTIQREIINGKAFFQLASLIPFLCIPLQNDDFQLIADADAGDAAAQTDLAVIFLSNNKASAAIYWLELAAKQDFPDAMNHLGYCHACGRGLAKDESLGLLWIARAAALGHEISKKQVCNIPWGLNCMGK